MWDLSYYDAKQKEGNLYVVEDGFFLKKKF